MVLMYFIVANLLMFLVAGLYVRDWKGFLTILIIDILVVVLIVVGCHYGCLVQTP